MIKRVNRDKLGWVKRYNQISADILESAQHCLDSAGSLDTAVSDTMSTGIAYMLYVAYDCKAVALGLEDEAFTGFITHAVEQWFRERGYAEWFCHSASHLFSTSRPCTRAEREQFIVFRRSSGKKPKKAKAA